jgi:hypothetical protein
VQDLRAKCTDVNDASSASSAKQSVGMDMDTTKFR